MRPIAIGITVGLVALAAYLSFDLSRPATTSYGPCDLEEPIAVQPAPAEDPGVLKLEDPAGMIIPFGRSRDVHPEIFYLTMEEGSISQRSDFEHLNVKKRPLRRQEVYATIFPEEYEAVARITGPREATVRVCIPAQVVGSVHPGTYSGGIVIADPRVQRTTVSITVSLQYRRYQPIVVLFGFGVLVFGMGSVWAAGRRAAAREVLSTTALGDFLGWAKANVVPLIAGGAAALSAFTVSYWRNPAWGAKAPEDWLTLFGAMFSAFTAAVVTTSRAGGESLTDLGPQEGTASLLEPVSAPDSATRPDRPEDIAAPIDDTDDERTNG